MSFSAGNFGAQTGNDLTFHVLQAVAAGRLEVLRPEILYTDYIPSESFDTSIAPGSKDYSKIFGDQSGVASWRGQGSNDVPTIGTYNALTNVPIFNGGIGNVLDARDIRQGRILAARGFDEDPTIRTAQVMRIAVEYFIERLMFFGDGIFDQGGGQFYPGLLNHPLIPQSTVAVGASTFTTWDTKTADEIIFDMFTAIGAMYSSTNTVHMVSDIYIPVTQFNQITSTKAGVRANDEVIIKFMSEQNMTMVLTGREINIRPLRYLEGAGVGATDRMIVVDKKPDHYMVGQPMDFNILPVERRGFLYEYWGEFEISPLHFPYPRFAAYYDGI